MFMFLHYTLVTFFSKIIDIYRILNYVFSIKRFQKNFKIILKPKKNILK